MPRRPRHRYAADIPRGLPDLLTYTARKFPPLPHSGTHRVRAVLDLLDMELLQIREQQVQAAGFLACQAVLHNDLAAASSQRMNVQERNGRYSA